MLGEEIAELSLEFRGQRFVIRTGKGGGRVRLKQERRRVEEAINDSAKGRAGLGRKQQNGWGA